MLERLKDYSEEILQGELAWLRKIRRRDFFKAFAISFPFATVASYLSSDIVNIQEDIPVVETKYGNFRFLYEVHDKGITTDDLPKSKKIDLFWREGVPANNVNFKDAEPSELVKEAGVSDEMLEYCRNRGIKIGLGDIKVPEILKNHYLELAEAMGAASLLSLSQGLLKELEQEPNLDALRKTTRRG